jgi:hypothetical protein
MNNELKDIANFIIGASSIFLLNYWVFGGTYYINYGLTEGFIKSSYIFFYPLIIILFVSIICRMVLEK